MQTGGSVSGQLTGGGLAAATVVLLDYFLKLSAPPAIIAAMTTVLTAFYLWVWPFIPKKQTA